ncbi:D-glycero-alpha-D-manno-heptose-1,7-bisphosphate 7-phosphatase [Chloroflexota bacterium]
MEKAVFLDRDGIIIKDTGYIGEVARVELLPSVGEVIRLLYDNGFKVIVITNQAGVARGYFTEEAVQEVNNFIKESLAQEIAIIDDFYYCPHHVEGVIEEYRKECYNRKPNPGMIEKAESDYNIDLKQSFIIGDKSSDVEAGYRAGCRTILLTGQDYQGSIKNSDVIPDFTAHDLHEAARWLVEATIKGHSDG